MVQSLRLAFAAMMFAAALGADASGQEFIPGDRPKVEEDPGAEAADVDHSAWKWEFDALTAGLIYETELTIHNLCPSDQLVSVFVTDLPDLTLDLPGCGLNSAAKSCAKVVPPGDTVVKGTIKPEVFFYYVDPMAPHATPRPFKRITGQIVVFHAKAGNCLPRRDQYNVQYEVHALKGEVPPPPPGPERIAGAGPCQVWWNTGQRPTMLKPEQRCESEIRPLAIGYRERILPPYIEKAPNDWAWLPTSDQMLTMSSEELVAMKLRAEKLIPR